VWVEREGANSKAAFPVALCLCIACCAGISRGGVSCSSSGDSRPWLARRVVFGARPTVPLLEASGSGMCLPPPRLSCCFSSRSERLEARASLFRSKGQSQAKQKAAQVRMNSQGFFLPVVGKTC
jgi:hypothetical protein